MNDMVLTLAVCRIIHFLHFGEDMPSHMSYQAAANRVFDMVDWKAFDVLVAQAKAIEPDYGVMGLSAVALHADTSADHIDSDQEQS